MSRITNNIAMSVIALLTVVACMVDAEEPLSLVGTHWSVEDISSAGIVKDKHPTIHFVDETRVAGGSGCNRFTGSYESRGEALQFGALASTRRACRDALMDQEQRFYQAVNLVVAWRVDVGTGLLHLLDESGNTVIRAAVSEEPVE